MTCGTPTRFVGLLQRVALLSDISNGRLFAPLWSAVSLNYGAFEYARGVLRNWLEFYVKYDGYRFAETSQANSARELTLFAQYYDYTGDPDQLLLKYHEKIEYLVEQMFIMRKRGLALPKTSAAYGMPSKYSPNPHLIVILLSHPHLLTSSSPNLACRGERSRRHHRRLDHLRHHLL